MATLKTFLLLLFLLSRQNSPSSALKCKQLPCDKSGQIIIRFPFRVNQTDQPQRCGYPSFDLRCPDGQAILNIVDAGEFVVADVIDYWEPSIKIGDPQNCMAGRWLNYNYIPTFAPFQVSSLEYYGYDNYTFLNCTKNTTSLNLPKNTPIPCLSGDGHTVTALLTADLHLTGDVMPCAVISKTVWAPKPKFEPVFSDRVTLTWTDPDCKRCEVKGGFCEFGSESGHEVGCSYPSRIVQHLIAAAIILCFVSCFLALVFHVCLMSRSEGENMWTDPSSGVEIGSGRAGLDKVVVDSYPETVFGENKDSSSGPDDVTCSICISEYQEGEVLKTIPSCKHCFHGACIDEWLLKNATCPLCRILTHE